MHTCPTCGAACYCDGEDLDEQPAPVLCVHNCDDDDEGADVDDDDEGADVDDDEEWNLS